MHNFKAHIEGCVVRARQRSALIFRGFLSRNISNLMLAYTSFIRPLLEYAAPVWSPSLIHLNDSIESVQRAFTRRLPGYAKLTYCERLQKLKLQSLEHRRLIHDLVLCFKIVHGLSALQFTDFFKFSNTSFTRGHNLRLAFPLIKCSTRRNFFAYRVIKPWNSLPPLVVNAKSAQSFKSRLSSVDLSIYLKYPFISIHWLHVCFSNPSWPIHCVYIVSLIHVINFSFPLISSDEIKCPFFNVVYFKCFIDFNDFRCYFLFMIVFWVPNLILL
jgi:hypothetical protein